MEESVKREIKQLCQEQILWDAKEEQFKAQQELERILALVKEVCRQQGKTIYNPLAPEWEEQVKGRG